MSQIEALRAALPHLPVSDHKFAQSLLAKAEQGKATPKMLVWIDKLIEHAADAATVDDGVPDFTADLTVGTTAGIMKLFDKAKVKYPKIRLVMPDGVPLVLTRAGDKSKYKGQITATDGRKYPNNTFFGRVRVNGDWNPGRDISPGQAFSVLALLTALAQDPAKVISEQGKLTGHCVLCMLPLTDPKSLEAGYGKQCAANFQLPYG